MENKEKIEQIQEILREQVIAAIKNGENLDFASWGYEAGVLITANQAIEILKILDNLNTGNNENDKKIQERI